jgi:hypothetical protein
MKFLGPVIALFASAALHAECTKDLGAFKIDGQKIGDSFTIEEKELKALPKPGNKVLALKFKSSKNLEPRAEELLYYKTLYVYDDLLAKKRCPASASRVFFMYPKRTATISTKDLARVRKLKDRPKWQAAVNLRTQVTHGKN